MSHVSLRLVFGESVVFVVEWICLVVMTRDLVLVKGSQQGARSHGMLY